MVLQGVRLMFYDSKADVLLLMITATIPDKFKPYLLGFDASEDAVPRQAVGIHHPNGSVKRISYANDRYFNFQSLQSITSFAGTSPLGMHMTGNNLYHAASDIVWGQAISKFRLHAHNWQTLCVAALRPVLSSGQNFCFCVMRSNHPYMSQEQHHDGCRACAAATAYPQTLWQRSSRAAKFSPATPPTSR